MIDFFARLFGSDFMPHAHCFLWHPGVLWLHVVADAVIALAYFSIPVALAVLARERSDFRVSGVLSLFASFIFLCGLTHVLGIWTMWDPVYRLEGVIKALTAGVSVVTAAAVWPLLPKILAVPNPTELASANDALRTEMAERRAAEERFRMLLESAPDAMVIVDGEGRIELANLGCEVLFGHRKEDLIGQPVEMLIPERIREQHVAHRTRYVEAPRPQPMGRGRELFGVRSDGSEFPVEVSLSPLQTPTGVLVSSTIRDITDHREAERTLRDVNAELTRRVQERTAELARHASELSRSNEELEQFAYVISHDLKSPMRGIASLAEWLVADYADRLDEEGRIQLELINERAARLHDMIDGVLEYSVATKEIDTEEVDVSELLEEVVDALAPPTGIEIRVEAMPRVHYPRVQLLQVFQNLISNAIRHMGRETGSIHVTTRQDADDFTFCVSDDGPGIPEEHHERIFRMFQTLSPRSGQKAQGLGLSIVKKIVERNGGAVHIESSAGTGTSISFTLPRERPPEAAAI